MPETMAVLREYLGMFKGKIALLLVYVALATAVLVGDISPGTLFVLALAGFLASAGTGPINHYLDREIDALMRRTRNRPMVRGTVNHRTSIFLGVGAICLGLFISASFLGWLASAFMALGAATYLLVYTFFLKRRTWLSIVIGGGAGAFAVLAGWAAAGAPPGPLPFILAFMVFLWTPSHFWSFSMVHLQDYSAARLPMLPVVKGRKKTSFYIFIHSLALVLLSALLYIEASFSAAYLMVVVPAGAYYLYHNLTLALQPSRAAAWKSYRFSGIYLAALFGGALFDRLTQTPEWISFIYFLIELLSAPYTG